MIYKETCHCFLYYTNTRETEKKGQEKRRNEDAKNRI